MSQNQAVAAGTRIGHVHLKVADLEGGAPAAAPAPPTAAKTPSPTAK